MKVSGGTDNLDNISPQEVVIASRCILTQTKRTESRGVGQDGSIQPPTQHPHSFP